MIEVAVGIDIGGTNTRIGFIDEAGNSHAETIMSTGEYDSASDFIKALNATILVLNEQRKFKLLGIGVGAPNGNYYRGTIEYAPNLNWKGVIHFAEELGKLNDLPIILTNDANAAAIGEMIFGAAKNRRDFIMITLGTGLGSGIVVDGKLVYGHDGFAGEIGHTTVFYDGRKCGCGRRGCLETYVSAPGIIKTVKELRKAEKYDSPLMKMSSKKMSAKLIADLANERDSLALKAFDVTARILGKKLADCVAFTSPEVIYLFGGLALAGDLLLRATRAYFYDHLMNIYKGNVDIELSELQQHNAAVLGSSALIWADYKQRSGNA